MKTYIIKYFKELGYMFACLGAILLGFILYVAIPGCIIGIPIGLFLSRMEAP
jgi:hypothetical protein